MFQMFAIPAPTPPGTPQLGQWWEWSFVERMERGTDRSTGPFLPQYQDNSWQPDAACKWWRTQYSQLSHLENEVTVFIWCPLSGPWENWGMLYPRKQTGGCSHAPLWSPMSSWESVWRMHGVEGVGREHTRCVSPRSPMEPLKGLHVLLSGGFHGWTRRKNNL